VTGYVYIIQSETSSRYYIGSAKDVAQRLAYHNSGKVIATRNKGPWIVKHAQEYPTATMARKIEYKLKRLKNKTIIDRIVSDQIIKIGA